MTEEPEITEEQVAEAERENEEAEQPEPEQPEPEQPEPEQPEPMTQARAESILASLERYRGTVAREVAKRAGPMFDDLVPCPLCSQGSPTLGYIFPELPEPENSMRRAYVEQALGGEPEAEYLDSPTKHKCDRCNGYGMLRTGSHVPNQDKLPCDGCDGNGWKQDIFVPDAQHSTHVDFTQPNAATNGNTAETPTDPWGRPLGHRHYGLAPALVS